MIISISTIERFVLVVRYAFSPYPCAHIIVLVHNISKHNGLFYDTLYTHSSVVNIIILHTSYAPTLSSSSSVTNAIVKHWRTMLICVCHRNDNTLAVRIQSVRLQHYSSVYRVVQRVRNDDVDVVCDRKIRWSITIRTHYDRARNLLEE